MKEDDPTHEANWNHVREFWRMFFKTTPHIIFSLIHTESAIQRPHVRNTRLNPTQNHFVEATKKAKIETQTVLVRGHQRELLEGFGKFARLGLCMTRSAARNSFKHSKKE